jgi:hypothetical protein
MPCFFRDKLIIGLRNYFTAVAWMRETIKVITKNGKPVSVLKPYRAAPDTLFGIHKDSVTSEDDLIAPIDASWNVE